MKEDAALLRLILIVKTTLFYCNVFIRCHISRSSKFSLFYSESAPSLAGLHGNGSPSEPPVGDGADAWALQI